jgi:cytochrome c6
MNQVKAQHHMIFGSSILLALFVGLALFVVAIAQASPAPDSPAAATYRTKCAICHGPDGAGSEAGKSMKVPDLRSPAVQKLPDAQLAQVIADGKGGMPSFKNSLSEDQIHGLVAHVRSLPRQK